MSAAQEALNLWAERGLDTGIQRALEPPDVRDWIDEALEAIEELASGGMEFTADTLRALAGPPPSDPAMGAAFRVASQRKLIRAVGVTTTNRARAHGRLLRTWVGRRGA